MTVLIRLCIQLESFPNLSVWRCEMNYHLKLCKPTYLVCKGPAVVCVVFNGSLGQPLLNDQLILSFFLYLTF